MAADWIVGNAANLVDDPFEPEIARLVPPHEPAIQLDDQDLFRVETVNLGGY